MCIKVDLARNRLVLLRCLVFILTRIDDITPFALTPTLKGHYKQNCTISYSTTDKEVNDEYLKDAVKNYLADFFR